MRTRVVKACIFLVLIALVSGSANAAVQEAGNERFKAYYPDTISVFEPYTVRVVFLDREIAKQYRYVEVLGQGCSIPFSAQIGTEAYPHELVRKTSFHRIPYEGQEQMDLVLSMTGRGRISVPQRASCVIRMVEESDYTSPQYNPANRKVWDSLMRVEFEMDYHDYDVGISPVPEGFSKTSHGQEDYHLTNLESASYEKKTADERAHFQTGLVSLNSYEAGRYYTYTDLLDADEMAKHIRGGSSIKDKPIQNTEELNVRGQKGFIRYGCYRLILSKEDTYGGSEVYQTSCSYIGLIIKEFAAVEVTGYAETLTTLDSEASLALKEEEWKNVMVAALENTYFSSDGMIVDLVFEESEDDYCGDCKQGYVCGACGTCIKETKAINPSHVGIESALRIKNDGVRILNAIESNVALSAYPDVKLTHDGKRVGYCDLKAPGLSMTILGEVITEEPYSGFTSGSASDERELSQSCDVDLSERDPRCVFIVSPSSKKKFFEDAKEVIEEYRFVASINGEREEKTARITLTPPRSFELRLRSKTNQVQQGSTGVLEITPSGGTTDIIILKTTLLGPGRIGSSPDAINTDWILETAGRGETVKIAYAAPPLGNFDIGKELSTLSMTKLQTDAAKQIALDAVVAYGGEYAGNIEKLVEAGEYSTKIGHLTDTFKAVNGVRNIKGTDKAIKDMTGEFGDALQVTDGKQDATWAESAADVGVAGISAAQTAVGALTFIPNQIPGVSRLTAGFQTAFSAATNIWKANLQYISKSEKIERARELYYPVVITVTAQDISGWTVQEMHVFQIAYHQVN